MDTTKVAHVLQLTMFVFLSHRYNTEGDYGSKIQMGSDVLKTYTFIAHNVHISHT